MKTKTFILIAALYVSACTSSTESTESADAEAMEEPATESRYSYSNSFEMGDEANLEIVRNWNNAIEAGDIDLAFTYAADSLYVVLSDGTEFDNLPKDSMKTIVNQMFSNLSGVKVDFISAASIYSTDREEAWVISYTDETMTNSDGDSRAIAHELYRIVDGQIRAMYGYTAVPSADNPPLTEDHGDEYTYSGSFELGNSDNIAVVENFLDAIESNDTDAFTELLSDSVTVYFADGNVEDGVKDSLISMITDYLSNVDLEINHTGVLSLRSTDQNQEWVLVWIDETATSAEGEEAVILHEAYMMQEGKIRVMRQWQRTPPPEN